MAANDAPERKPRCFVISPIGDPNTPARRNADMVLHSIIERALEPDITVVRSDAFGPSEMITKNIIDAITTYELAVVDLTDHNPNVFYELGLRHMVEKPVIPICTQGQKIPFDNMGVSTIFYDVTDFHSHTATAETIKTCARSMLQSGYPVSNPVISARGEINLANSADTKDKIISSLIDRVSHLERRWNKFDDAARKLAIPTARNAIDSKLSLIEPYLDEDSSRWWKVSLPKDPPEDGK